VEEYRRLIVAARSGTLEELAAELTDRFGEAPLPVRQLIEVEGLKVKAARAGLESATMKGDELQLKFTEERAMALAETAAESEGIVDKNSAYVDAESKTLYLKLRFEEVNKRQELLLKWLNSIIDDIIFVGRLAS